MAEAVEALAALPRDRLPSASAVQKAVEASGLDLAWQPFGEEADAPNAYVTARGGEGDAFLSVSTQRLTDDERSDLAKRAARQTSATGWPGSTSADTLVRLAATAGPEFDWRRAFSVVLSAIVADAPDALVYLVNEDEYLAGADVAARVGRMGDAR
jgi:hypothetical protein